MARIELDLNGHREAIDCFVANLEYDVTLGRPWHNIHQPAIGWLDGSVTLNSGHCKQHCCKQTVTLYEFPRPTVSAAPTKKADIDGISAAALYKLARRKGAEVHMMWLFGPGMTSTQASSATAIDPFTSYVLKAFGMRARPVESKDPATACSMLVDEVVANQMGSPSLTPDSYSFRKVNAAAITASDYEKFMKKSGETKTVEDVEALKKRLPVEYRDLYEVFLKSDAARLPPHRPGVDHKINLKDGQHPPYKRPYPMSRQENDVIKTWTDAQLEKGFIRPTDSSAAAPVIIVKKPNGGLRVCQDFRGLNALTEKSRYPIPLFQDTLNQISNKVWYTKLDVIAAFNRIRIAAGDEWKTAFSTRYGQFECVVMPFGLCNAPGTFQSYINNTLREFLDVFVSCYLDDALIFSDSYEEHVQHVRKVLLRLREAGLQLDIDKCEFHRHETKYLGVIIGRSGIRMDPEKIDAVQNWGTPANVKDVLAFLGFANFYRRFIRNFSGIAYPMTQLTRTKDNAVWQWTPECQRAFDGLKAAFLKAPILAYFVPGRETVLETDASDFVTAAVLSQRDPATGFLHPIAFLSKKMSPQECNYDIYDKELMAIVKAFEEWRPELTANEFAEEGDFENLTNAEDKPTLVYSDHKNLEYFMTTKQLNRRQARWAEFLSRFFFKIVYRPGVQGTKPDSLTRRSQDLPADANDPRYVHQQQVILSPDRLLACATDAVIEDDDLLRDLKLLYTKDDVREAVQQMESGQPVKLLRRFRMDDENAHLIDGLIYVPNRHGSYAMFVPETDDDDTTVRVRIAKAFHEDPAAGHPGKSKTFELITRHYMWPRISRFVRSFIRRCRVCRTTKSDNQQYPGLLTPLPVPFGTWEDVAMDFVVQLPAGKCTADRQRYENILTVTDRLGKGRKLIPVLSMEAEYIAYIYIKYVMCRHGLPKTMVSDRGTQWTSTFWKRLCQLLGIKRQLSTAFHPETDGQSENSNKIMEQYLRAFCNYAQDDWPDWLPLAEFASFNTPSETTGVTPSMAETGKEQRFADIELNLPTELLPAKQRLDSQSADRFAKTMKDTTEFLRQQMTLAQATYKDNADAHRTPSPTYQLGDEVYVSTKNWSTERPSKKLDYRFAGPYAITEVLPGHAYRLDLPDGMRIHDTFHANLLRPADPPLPGQSAPSPPPIRVQQDDVEYEEYEVEKVVAVNSRLPPGRAPRGGKQPIYEYKVKWRGHERQDDLTWESAEELMEHAAASIADFHHDHPDAIIPPGFKPPPDWLPHESEDSDGHNNELLNDAVFAKAILLARGIALERNLEGGGGVTARHASDSLSRDAAAARPASL